MAENVQPITQLHSFHNASKVMLKILQARLQQYANRELPDVQARFRKGREIRGQIASICWIIEKTRKFQKNVYLCFINYAKIFDGVGHSKLDNSKRWGYQTILPASYEICMQVKKQQLELFQNWDRCMSRLFIVTLVI